jgi:predicted porin
MTMSMEPFVGLCPAERSRPTGEATRVVGSLILAFALSGSEARAQDTERRPDEAARQEPTVEDVLGGIDVYGRFLAHLAAYNEQAEMQGNGSRLGASVSIGDDLHFIAGIELGVSLIQATQFNAGAATSGSAFSLREESEETFGTRLGFLGTDFGSAGTLTLGKQRAVHYDIARYTTDQFNVFGGQGSQTYTAGTDGGTLGTGRVDSALQYRVQLDRIRLGGQLQFRTASGDNFLDGFGLAATVDVTEGLSLGGAYTRAIIEEALIEESPGLDGDAEFGILGARYDSDSFEAGVVVSTQSNGDVARLPDDDEDPESFLPVFFGASGFEVFGKVKPGQFALLGGFVYNEPRDPLDPVLSQDFVTRYAILGGEYWFRPNTAVYAEWRLDDSVNVDDTEGFDVLTVGFLYGFSFRGTTKVY